MLTEIDFFARLVDWLTGYLTGMETVPYIVA